MKSLSRPAQASLALRPAGSLNHQNRPLSPGTFLYWQHAPSRRTEICSLGTTALTPSGLFFKANASPSRRCGAACFRTGSSDMALMSDVAA